MDCIGAKALVTGAAKRVGRAIALELAGAGCAVAVHYHRSQREAESLADEISVAGGRAVLIQADLANPDAPSEIIEQVNSKLGGLDILVNNASVFSSKPESGFNYEWWQELFRVNVFAPAALISAAEKALATGRGGKVVNICDIAADRPWSAQPGYCCSKAALVNLTKAEAKRLAPTITVNGVSPGIAVFPEEYDEESRDKLVSRVPLKRAGSPEDIAAAVRFLVERGDFITGQIINVDGGRSIAW